MITVNRKVPQIETMLMNLYIMSKHNKAQFNSINMWRVYRAV